MSLLFEVSFGVAVVSVFVGWAAALVWEDELVDDVDEVEGVEDADDEDDEDDEELLEEAELDVADAEEAEEAAELEADVCDTLALVAELLLVGVALAAAAADEVAAALDAAALGELESPRIGGSPAAPLVPPEKMSTRFLSMRLRETWLRPTLEASA